MLRKKDTHHHYFEIQLNWQGGTKGIVMANEVKDALRVAAAQDFPGGVEGMWSPEHLFLSAVVSCHMTTFFAIAGTRGLRVTHFECSAIGHVEMREQGLAYTTIDLYPKVFVEKDTDIAVAGEALAEANRRCIIIFSLQDGKSQRSCSGS